MRNRVVAAILAVMVALFPAGEARAKDYCASLASTLSEKDLSTYHRELSRIVPARYAELAHGVRIVNVPASEKHYAPIVAEVADGVYEIQIPRGFTNLLCRTAVIQSIYPRALLTDRRLGGLVRDCVRDSYAHSASQCMYDVVLDLTEVGAEHGFEKNLDAHVIDVMLHGGMLTLILHEFGHVVGDHFSSDKTDVAKEREADSFAVLNTVLYGEDGLGIFGASAMFSVLSPLMDGVMRGPHGSFQCRGKSMKDVTFALWASVTAMQAWPRGNAERYLRFRSDNELTNLTVLFPGPLSAEGLRGLRCPGDSDAHLPAVRADVSRLLGALDRIVKAEGAGGPVPPFAFYEPLMALKLTTAEGRTIRASVIAGRLRALFDDVGDKPGKIPTRDYLRYVEKAMADTGEYIIARDYGLLLANRAAVRFAAGADSGDGRDAEQVLAATRADLMLSISYSRGTYESYYALMALELLAEDCDAAKRWLRLAEVVSSETQLKIVRWTIETIDTEVVRGGCKGIARRMPLPEEPPS